ncbi:FtsW/RodA/SpoVE family cell cycle protein [Crocinitomix catalasitica]|uniref:FtsW/RodA/SpoVE family cell cycle protein n=1 Tax=Crocinitomix catalasitica TaxID=184607 RepID=UPI000907BC70|nr:FtsW/RodA/SpoVE family cell cycle protein [Crocinitomix catalasitica]
MNEFFKYLKGDRNIWVIVLILGLISVVSVFSFIPILVKVKGLSYSYLFFKHTFLLVLGFVLMFFIHKIPIKILSKLSKIIFYLSIVLLVLTMLIGESVNGADRWLKIPFVPFSFQTSDFAKLALIIYLARQFVKRKDEFNDLKIVAQHILLPVAITLFLILPSNLSTAVLVGLLAFVMMIFAKFPWKWMLMSMGAVVGVFMLLLTFAKYEPEILPRVETWRLRLERMFDEEAAMDANENMQINNALTAIKNGAFTYKNGKLFGPELPGNGVLKHYIPEAYADFYFAALIEEGGIFTAIFIMMLYMWLFFRIIKVALAADSIFATYLALGIGVMILTQALVNMMVSTKLMPVTGQNMPLLSMGGTSAWFTCIAIGIVLGISRENNKSTKDTGIKTANS